MEQKSEKGWFGQREWEQSLKKKIHVRRRNDYGPVLKQKLFLVA